MLAAPRVRCTPHEQRPFFPFFPTHSFCLSVNSNPNKELSNRENWFRIQLGQTEGNKHECELQTNLAHYLHLHTACYSPYAYLPWIPSQKAASAALISGSCPCHLVNILHVALWLHFSFFPHTHQPNLLTHRVTKEMLIKQNKHPSACQLVLCKLALLQCPAIF